MDGRQHWKKSLLGYVGYKSIHQPKNSISINSCDSNSVFMGKLNHITGMNNPFWDDRIDTFLARRPTTTPTPRITPTSSGRMLGLSSPRSLVLRQFLSDLHERGLLVVATPAPTFFFPHMRGSNPNKCKRVGCTRCTLVGLPAFLGSPRSRHLGRSFSANFCPICTSGGF